MKIWIAAVCLIPTLAHGRVLIPSPEVRDSEYRALLRMRPEDSSPIERIRRQRPTQVHREELLNALAQAQQAFVSQSSEIAQARFREVTELLDKDDWALQDRSIFVYSFLRLAQLDRNSSDWLDRAASLGNDVYIERSLFPPPLLSELELRRGQLEKISISDDVLRDWPVVLINGRVCSQTKCAVEVSNNRLRVTWLSQKFQPQSAVIRAQDVRGFRPRQRPWLGGSCAQIEWSEEARQLGDGEPFFGFQCGSDKNSLHPTKESQSLPWPEAPAPMAKTAFYKSKWLWIGIGAVVTAAVIASQNKGKEEREPSTTYGY